VNFAQVAPGIFRSGQPDPQELSAARQDGIKTLLVLRSRIPEAERRVAARLGLAIVHVPMDANDIPPMDQVDRALDVVLDPSRRPILVHCAHGQERTGAVIAAYRVVSESWTPAAAEKEALDFHFRFKNLADFLARYREHRRR
jgi:protein tyrosine/serine phosphatase